MKSNLTKSFALGFALALGAAATAAAQVPSFGATVPGSWSVDRYLPTTFDLTNNTHGRNDVLNIGITSAGDLANRPAAFQSTFYNTQGEGTALSTPAGSFSLTADLWVNNSWASNAPGTNNSVRTDMWGVAVDNTDAAEAYAIIGFTNFSGTGLFRGWDPTLGVWDNFLNPVNYGAWNSLTLSWNSSTDIYTYSVNGLFAASMAGDGGAVGVGAMIMQAYNFNDPALTTSGNGSSNYTAQWSNDPATLSTPEPASIALLATGLVGIAGVVRRRRKA